MSNWFDIQMHRCHQTEISHPFMVRAHQSSEFDPSRKLSVHKEVQEGYLLLYYSSSNTFTRFSNNLQNFQLRILIIFQNIMVLVWAWKPWSNNNIFIQHPVWQAQHWVAKQPMCPPFHYGHHQCFRQIICMCNVIKI